MRVLHVITAPRAEGTPRLVLDWLSVPETDQAVLFLKSEGELLGEFRKTGVQIILNDKFTLSISNGLKVTRLVRETCASLKPDIVISWPTGFSQWIHLGARRAGVTKLLTHAGNPPGKGFLYKYIYSYMSFWPGYLLGSKVIACSDYIRNEFQSIPLLPKSMFVRVYNCLNLSRLLNTGIARRKDQAIIVATLEPHKDHETLLHAWKLVEGSGRNLRLLLAGGGSKEKPLKKLAAELQLSNAEFLGGRSDIPDLLSQSKVFVLSTTKQEGFGTVLLEALAAGCIVVATDVPACREVLVGGRYGALVPPGNVQALADAMIKAFDDTDVDSKRNEGEAYLAEFSQVRMMNEYLRIASSL